jgi:hypothetical protein
LQLRGPTAHRSPATRQKLIRRRFLAQPLYFDREHATTAQHPEHVGLAGEAGGCDDHRPRRARVSAPGERNGRMRGQRRQNGFQHVALEGTHLRHIGTPRRTPAPDFAGDRDGGTVAAARRISPCGNTGVVARVQVFGGTGRSSVGEPARGREQKRRRRNVAASRDSDRIKRRSSGVIHLARYPVPCRPAVHPSRSSPERTHFDPASTYCPDP